MDNKIKEMIHMAAEDGVITDAERALILKKAKELGEDVDMVELAIEGEIGNLKTEDKRKKAKGTKCPHCGGIIPSGEAVCPDCGFILTKNEANHTATQLQKDLDEIEKEKQAALTEASKQKRGMFDMNDPVLTIQEAARSRKITRITNTVIPNTRADLLELLAFSAAKADKTAPKSGASLGREDNLGYMYWELFNNCVMMAKTNFPNDPNFQHFFVQQQQMSKKKGLSNGAKLAIILPLSFVFLFGFVFLMIYLGMRVTDQPAQDQASEVVINSEEHSSVNENHNANPDGLLDDIYVQQANNYISIGLIEEAKKLADEIKDTRKKRHVMNAISRAERDKKRQ